LQLAAPKKCMQNFFLFYRKTCLTVWNFLCTHRENRIFLFWLMVGLKPE
jgi:hypothetical protein